jgi:hypothetical protein
MPVREGPPQPAPPSAHKHNMPPVDRPEPYSAEKARAGETILRTPARRIIFIAGLACAVVIGLLLRVFA